MENKHSSGFHAVSLVKSEPASPHHEEVQFEAKNLEKEKGTLLYKY